jgi:[ribosomal protein S18]-alanine N-acetyltransferase
MFAYPDAGAAWAPASLRPRRDPVTTTYPAIVLTTFTFEDEAERSAFRQDRLDAVARFLFEHLGRYGDPLDQIQRCLRRASGNAPTDGGTVTLAEDGGEIVGAVVTNDTHMAQYTPENLLVYIATHAEHRGRGIGSALMERAIASVDGSIALHVEHDNPAAALYRKLGFTSKYLEMRLER